MTNKHIFSQLKIEVCQKGLHSFAFYILIFAFSFQSLTPNPQSLIPNPSPLTPNVIVHKYLRADKVLYNCRETFTYVMSPLQIRPFMQNKANFRKSQMNVTEVLTEDYENKTLGERRKNKPNSKPNKANSKPIKANIMPKQTQYKPKQTQFQTMSQNADSLVNFSIQLLYYHIDNHDTKNGKSFDHKGLICDYILQFDFILLSEPFGAMLV